MLREAGGGGPTAIELPRRLARKFGLALGPGGELPFALHTPALLQARLSYPARAHRPRQHSRRAR
jgi:hypothetical protein